MTSGWNAVYLEVDPANHLCDALFSAYPQIESVWKYDRKFTTVQFQQNSNTPLPDPAHWIAWLPANHREAFLRKLLEVQGGYAYLFKIVDGAAPFVWTLKGTPARPSDQWSPNSLNLAGFAVDQNSPPTVAAFFQGINEINLGPGSASQIFSVNSDSSESQIRQPERTLLKAGTSYWVRVERFLHSALPFAIEGDYAAAHKIDFGTDGVESHLTLHNLLGGTPLTLSFAILLSEVPPNGNPELAGPVPLARFVSDPLKKDLRWQSITNRFEVNLGPGQSQDLQLAVQRTLLRSYRAAGTNGAAYQSLLEVKELTHGVRLLVPITAESQAIGVINGSKARASASSTSTSSLPLYSLSQGLWVGEAKLAQVNRPSYSTDSDLSKSSAQLLNASSPLTTRLIVHVDTNGNSRLLQRALLLWQPAAGSTSTNGNYVLYTDESRVPASTQDVFRVSSVTLPVMAPQLMTGTFGESLLGNVLLDYDDPVNPFKHKYHPDHDNLDESFSTNKLSAGKESFTVNRQILLNFDITHQLDDGSYVPAGAVLTLDGQKSYVAIDPVTFGQNATIEAWVKAGTNLTSDQFVFYSNAGLSNSLSLSILGTNHLMEFGCTSALNAASSLITTTNAFPLGQWVYVAAVVDGASLKGQTEARIYWNGSEVASGIVNFPGSIAWTNVYFGRGPDSNPAFLSGSIYDLTLWGDVREPSEILGDMHMGYAPNPNNLLASFPADDGSGVLLTDANGGPLQAHVEQAGWDDNAGYRTAFWDIGEREGVYSETITGLRPQPILVQGTFTLQRLNNDGTVR
jgi:hypothetical protein